MKKLIMFGAGNIGRSFIAQLFSRAGYETVFIDVDGRIIDALNRSRRYMVEIRDTRPSSICVENVRGIHAGDRAAIAAEFRDADIAATAVGPNNLPGIYPLIADGLKIRRRENARLPLDIIICENLRNASAIVEAGLRANLSPDFDDAFFPGLVETSIGKMVPLITHEMRERDILTVYAEEYNSLILDRKGFRGAIPPVPGLEPKSNMKAYVDRKLFIHNLGHSTAAYLGHIAQPAHTYIWQAIEDADVRGLARAAMRESRDALIAEYPDEFNDRDLDDHIDDLLRRFGNRALGDTIYRVGRDLARKLSPNERLAGTLALVLKHGLPHDHVLLGIAAALQFDARDEDGRNLPGDADILAKAASAGPASLLPALSGISADSGPAILPRIETLYRRLAGCRNEAAGNEPPPLAATLQPN